MVDYSKWDKMEAALSDSEDDARDKDSRLNPAKLAAAPDHDHSWLDFTQLAAVARANGDEFIQFGHIKMHAKDHPSLWPAAIFKSDPASFTPPPSPDGRIIKWGLDDECDLDVKMFQTRSMAQNMYNNFVAGPEIGTPPQQFIAGLAKRKMTQIGDASVQCLMNADFTLKIALVDVPEVWRTFVVPASTSLANFHDQIITPIMGWARAYHGYAFEDPTDGSVFGPTKYDGAIDSMHVHNAYFAVADDRKVPLALLLRRVGSVCYYVYDLGDSWEHEIEVLHIDKNSSTSEVRLLAGVGACPPEDSNGLDDTGNHGYSKLIQAFKKNAKKCKAAVKEVENTATNYQSNWLTGKPLKFRPLDYDLEFHQLMLEAMLAGPAVRKAHTTVFSPNEFKESFKACINCGNRLRDLKTCSGCGKVHYCSHECQKKHWKEHKEKCKSSKKASRPAPS